MDEARGPDRNSPTASPTAKALVPVVALHLLMWCFITGTSTDAGFASSVCSCVLLGYWGVVWLLWALRIIRGRSLNWVVAVTGWFPPVGCGVWLMWLSGLFRA